MISLLNPIVNMIADRADSGHQCDEDHDDDDDEGGERAGSPGVDLITGVSGVVDVRSKVPWKHELSRAELHDNC